MRTIQGVSVSAGIAIGTVRVLAAVDYAVERRLIDDPQAEMDRFRAARDTAVAQLKQLRDNVAAEFGENKAELFDAHRLMLQDPDYAECVEGLIAQDKVNAEFAVKSAAEQFAAMFAAMDSSTMQARAADVKDVSRRVMNVLQGKRDSTAQDGSVQGDAVQNGIVQNGIAQNGESHIRRANGTEETPGKKDALALPPHPYHHYKHGGIRENRQTRHRITRRRQV